MGSRWSIVDIEPVEVARQLTLLAQELLQNIQSFELLGSAWTKADKWTRAPNVMKSISHFNKVRAHRGEGRACGSRARSLARS
ncbi:RasGEF domain-containing protein, partial [Acinetobacter baumannii]